MATLLDICNAALSAIAKGKIQSINEPSREAEECATHYPLILEEMAEWSDHLPFARGRQLLAEIPNDRPQEWSHAFAAPHDMATPRAILWHDPTASPAYTSNGRPWQESVLIPFEYENGVIYTNAPTPMLEFAKKTVEVSEMPSLWRAAFQAELEARIAYPLTKDDRLTTAKVQYALVKKLEAIADAENKNPRKQPEYISDAERARLGEVI